MYNMQYTRSQRKTSQYKDLCELLRPVRCYARYGVLYIPVKRRVRCAPLTVHPRWLWVRVRCGISDPYPYPCRTLPLLDAPISRHTLLQYHAFLDPRISTLFVTRHFKQTSATSDLSNQHTQELGTRPDSVNWPDRSAD
jgi:hypothetical protein